MNFETPPEKSKDQEVEDLRVLINGLNSKIEVAVDEETEFRAKKRDVGASQGVITHPETLRMIKDRDEAETKLKSLTEGLE